MLINLHQELMLIIAQLGPDSYLEPRRCEAALNDTILDHFLEKNLLVLAVKAKIPQQLSQASMSNTELSTHQQRYRLSTTQLIEQLSCQLVQTYGVSEAYAKWSCLTWSLALKLIDNADFSFLSESCIDNKELSIYSKKVDSPPQQPPKLPISAPSNWLIHGFYTLVLGLICGYLILFPNNLPSPNHPQSDRRLAFAELPLSTDDLGENFTVQQSRLQTQLTAAQQKIAKLTDVNQTLQANKNHWQTTAQQNAIKLNNQQKQNRNKLRRLREKQRQLTNELKIIKEEQSALPHPSNKEPQLETLQLINHQLNAENIQLKATLHQQKQQFTEQIIQLTTINQTIKQQNQQFKHSADDHLIAEIKPKKCFTKSYLLQKHCISKLSIKIFNIGPHHQHLQLKLQRENTNRILHSNRYPVNAGMLQREFVMKNHYLPKGEYRLVIENENNNPLKQIIFNI